MTTDSEYFTPVNKYSQESSNTYQKDWKFSVKLEQGKTLNKSINQKLSRNTVWQNGVAVIPIELLAEQLSSTEGVNLRIT